MNDVNYFGRLTFMCALGQTLLPLSKIRQFYSIHVAFRFSHVQKPDILTFVVKSHCNDQ